SSRSDSSGCGAGSVMIPVFAICRRSWYTSEILPAVGEVKRFVDEREIGNDVAHHRVLEKRPVLPRRVVRVRAVDAVSLRRFQRDEHFAAPALDPAHAAPAAGALGERDADL